MAGVALGEVHLHFAWQAWHLVTSTVTLRGRRGTHGIGLALVARLVLGVTPWRRGVLRGRRGAWRHAPQAPSLCMAGVALGDIHRSFAWTHTHTPCPHTTCHHTTCSHRTSPLTYTHTHTLSSHNLTSTLTLRGRRGT